MEAREQSSLGLGIVGRLLLKGGTLSARNQVLLLPADRPINRTEAARHSVQRNDAQMMVIRLADLKRNAEIDSARQRKLKTRRRISHYSHHDNAGQKLFAYLHNQDRYWRNWYAQRPKMRGLFTPHTLADADYPGYSPN